MSWCDAILGFWIGVAATMAVVALCDDRDSLRRTAIEAGVAEYRVIDPTTGQTEFRFVPCSEGRK